MAKYHRHSIWITVFFKSDDGIAFELNEILPIHAKIVTAIFWRLYCKHLICKAKCSANKAPRGLRIIRYE